MNENDGLKLDDAALRLFFQEDTLYLKPENPTVKQTMQVIPSNNLALENPATPVFEGGKNSPLLMIFRHEGPQALSGAWGEMILGMIQNERAMNLKLEEVARLNLNLNPDLTLDSLIKALPAKKIVVWGNTNETWIDELPLLSFTSYQNRTLYRLGEPSSYLDKESKGILWQFIKTHLLA